MRTTISLEDALGKAARRRAREEGVSMSALVARALRALLTEKSRSGLAKPFRLLTVRGPGLQPGIDLDRTSALLVAEDQAAFGANPRDR